MKKSFRPDYWKWGYFYVITNEIALAIGSIYTLFNSIWGINITSSESVYVVVTGLQYIVSLVGYPIYSTVVLLMPHMGEYELRTIGVLYLTAYLLIAFILFELLRLFIKTVRSKSMYSEEAYKFLTPFICTIAFGVFGNFAWNIYAIATQYWLVNTSTSLHVGDYIIDTIAQIPFMGIVVIVGMLLLKKLYKESIELKKDVDLTV